MYTTNNNFREMQEQPSSLLSSSSPPSKVDSRSKQRKQQQRQPEKLKTEKSDNHKCVLLPDIQKYNMFKRSGSHASGLSFQTEFSQKTTHTEQTVATAESRISGDGGEDDDASFRVTRLIDDVMEETDEDLQSTVTTSTKGSHGSKSRGSRSSTSSSKHSKSNEGLSSRGSRHSIDKPSAAKKFPSNVPRSYPASMSKSSPVIHVEGGKKKSRPRRVSSLGIESQPPVSSVLEKSRSIAADIAHRMNNAEPRSSKSAEDHRRRRPSSKMRRLGGSDKNIKSTNEDEQSSIRSSNELFDSSMSDESASIRLRSHFALTNTSSLQLDASHQSAPQIQPRTSLPLHESLLGTTTTGAIKGSDKDAKGRIKSSSSARGRRSSTTVLDARRRGGQRPKADGTDSEAYMDESAQSSGIQSQGGRRQPRNYSMDLHNIHPSTRQSREARRLEFRKFQHDMQEKQKVRGSLDNLPAAGGAIRSHDDDDDTIGQFMKDHRQASLQESLHAAPVATALDHFAQIGHSVTESFSSSNQEWPTTTTSSATTTSKQQGNHSPKLDSPKKSEEDNDHNLDHLMKNNQKSLDGHFKVTTFKSSAGGFEDDASLDTVDHFVRDQQKAGTMKLTKPQATTLDDDSFRLFEQDSLDAIDPTALDSPQPKAPKPRMSALDFGLSSNMFDNEEFPVGSFQESSKRKDKKSDRQHRADRSRSRSSTRKEGGKHDRAALSPSKSSRKSKNPDAELSKSMSKRNSRRKSKNVSKDTKGIENDTSSKSNKESSQPSISTPSRSKSSRRLNKSADNVSGFSGSLTGFPTVESTTATTTTRRSRKVKDPSLDSSNGSKETLKSDAEKTTSSLEQPMSNSSSRRNHRKTKDLDGSSSNKSKDTLSKTQVEKERRRSSRRRASLATLKLKADDDNDLCPETPISHAASAACDNFSPASIDTNSTSSSNDDDQSNGGKVIRAHRRRKTRLGSTMMHQSLRGIDRSPRSSFKVSRSASSSQFQESSSEERKRDRRKDLVKAVSSFAT